MSCLNSIGWHYDVIKSVVVTEKSSNLKENYNKVTVNVMNKFSKSQVKFAFEKIFNVKIEKINSINIAGKKLKFKGFAGKKNDVKKMIITFADAKNFDFNL